MRDIESDETAPSARAQAANAWEKIEERKRILRGAPLPGSLRPEKPAKVTRTQSPVILESEPESKPPAE